MISAKLILIYMLTVNAYDLPNDVDPNQAYCLAINMYHEARGETMQGQIAVASVVMTRVRDPRFPATVCGVVYSTSRHRSTQELQCQFSWHCDTLDDEVAFIDNDINEPDEAAFKRVAAISILMLGGVIADNTQGATHYYNHDIVYPNWASAYTQTTVIGSHTFVRREKGSMI